MCSVLTLSKCCLIRNRDILLILLLCAAESYMLSSPRYQRGELPCLVALAEMLYRSYRLTFGFDDTSMAVFLFEISEPLSCFRPSRSCMLMRVTSFRTSHIRFDSFFSMESQAGDFTSRSFQPSTSTSMIPLSRRSAYHHCRNGPPQLKIRAPLSHPSSFPSVLTSLDEN
jgi:hypothetical protein